MAADTPNFQTRKPRQVLFSLRTKLIVYFVLLFIVIFGSLHLVQMYGLPFTNFRGNVGTMRDEVLRDVGLAADLKKQHLMDWLHERDGDAQAFSSTHLVGAETQKLLEALGTFRRAGNEGRKLKDRMIAHESYRLLQQHLQVVRGSYGFYGSLSIVEMATGQVLVSTDDARFGDDMSTLTSLKRSALTRRVCFDSVLVDHRRHRLTLPIVCAIGSLAPPTERIEAALLINVDVDAALRPILRTGHGMGRSGEALLVDKSGVILVALKHALADGSVAQPLQHQIQAKPAWLAAHGQEGLIETIDYRGVPVLAAYRHLRVSPSFGWGMVVKIDRAEAFALLHEAISLEVLTIMLSLLLVIGATIFLARQLVSPIRKLGKTAERIAAGELDAREIPMSNDEVGRLADTFNHMAERVQRSVTDLESKVRQRTSEVVARSKELEQIIYVASHDLRSPLVNIDGYGKVLSSDMEKLNKAMSAVQIPNKLKEQISFLIEKDIPEALRFIGKSTGQMDALIAGLLKLSRFGRLAFEPKSLDLNAIVGNVAASFAFKAGESGVKLLISDLPRCFGDEIHVNQVFANLIDNGIKYRSREGSITITISGRQEQGMSIYCVEDSGLGIAPRDQARIFDLFHRLDPAANEGEGLGLTIVKLAVSRMHGEITVDSDVGKGSRFYVSLPTG